jgi:hypothetical protein
MEKECWTHIANRWSEEMYAACREDWKTVQKQAVYGGEGGYKCRCGVSYLNDMFISSKYNVCAMCDYWVQPYLSNPRNKKLVEKYIPRQYHHYIFPIT